MNKKTLIILLFLTLFFNVFSEIDEHTKKAILRQSKEIMKFMFEDDSFIDDTYDIDFYNMNYKGGLNCISLVFKNENEKLNIYHFEYSGEKIAIVQQSEWHNEIKNDNFSLKDCVYKTRLFLKRFRPDLNQYFLKINGMRKASGNVSNGFYLRLYYKGYPTTERIFASYFNNGIPDYISIDNPSDYIIPKKIISLKEAREVIKNYLKENWSKELLWSTKGKKNKKYWGWHNVAEEFVFIDLDDHKNRPPLACYSRIDHTEPMFVHPNMNIGKYKVNYIKKGEKYIKDYSNLEKYNLSLEDFSNYGKHANFSRLAYIVTIDAPVISRDRDYAMFLVDAETGEIIGGY